MNRYKYDSNFVSSREKSRDETTLFLVSGDRASLVLCSCLLGLTGKESNDIVLECTYVPCFFFFNGRSPPPFIYLFSHFNYHFIMCRRMIFILSLNCSLLSAL
uniref:Uncharacterized protein n=1 Tax=Cacopsylla melanoneura TaxID=428564 RepID=A0A8D8QYW5_9HEMI